MARTVAPGTASSPVSAVAARVQDPGSYDVLVLDAATKQSLASARSLGRAGLRVAVAECFAECNPSLPVLAFRSRYSARNLVLPSFAADAAAFSADVIDFVRAHSTRMVLPAMDGTIAAVMPLREQLAAVGCVLALPSDSVLDIANDKDRTLEVARALGIEYPRTMRIDSMDDVPAVLAAFDFPVVLKPTTSWASQSAIRLQPVDVVDQGEAVDAIGVFLRAGVSVLAQQWASGRREGVTMFIVDDDVLACCAHVAHRTTPALGGVSVMRESVPIPPDIYAAAARLVKAIGLQGACEVEFRRDADGRPLLMEINPRLAGTIENSVRSGVDLPLMIWRWATGQPVSRVEGYKIGVRTRWLRGDMQWFRANFRRVGRPDSVSRKSALWIFGTEFLRTLHYDCLDRHDLGPILAEWGHTIADIRRSLRRRSPSEA